MCDRVNIEEIIDTMEQSVREDYDADTDVYDRVWETVDGSEWVIYYSKAAQIVESAEDNERTDAYEVVMEETGPAGVVSYDTLHTLMAYEILRDRLTGRVLDLL